MQADALIARQLEREEAEAHKTCFLKTWSDGHGSTYGRFKIPDLPAAILTTALEAYANPHRPDPITRDDVATTPGVRPSVVRTARTPPPGPAPAVRRTQRHRGRHDDPRHPPRWATGRQHPGHRHPALPQPSPPTGRRRFAHPRRPRQPIPAPRPRPTTTHLHPTPTPRHGPPARRSLQHHGLPAPRHLVRRQPPTPLEHKAAAPTSTKAN